MRVVRFSVRLLAVGALLTIALGVPGVTLADTTAVADCAPPLPLEKAVFSDVVFVGHVTEVAAGGRSATVDVTEIWRGELPATVTVNGGADPTNPAEDDRSFDLGATYLFVPVRVDALERGVVVVDSICSSTTPWDDSLSALRPADVVQPTPVPTPSAGWNPLGFLGDLALPITTAALIGGAALVAAFVVAGRREA